MMRNFPASARRMISFAGMCYNCLHSDTIACDYAFLLAGVVIALVAPGLMLSFVLSCGRVNFLEMHRRSYESA